MKRPEDKPRNFHYVITEEDILEILIAMDNNDWDYVMDFFEQLEPNLPPFSLKALRFKSSTMRLSSSCVNLGGTTRPLGPLRTTGKFAFLTTSLTCFNNFFIL